MTPTPPFPGAERVRNQKATRVLVAVYFTGLTAAVLLFIASLATSLDSIVFVVCYTAAMLVSMVAWTIIRGANDSKDRLPEAELDDLSLGNQKRVQLAASLIHDPDILILDEPFSGLDPVAVDVMSTMLTARAANGVPVVFSSHQLDLVQRLCDRVGIVTRGRMVAEGTVDELRTRGPVRYRVGTTARGWYPEDTVLIDDAPNHVVLETNSTDDDQRILRAALAAGDVHEFTRVVPDLTDLFKEVVK